MFQVNPFLHVDSDRIYNPLTDRALTTESAGYGTVRDLATSALGLESLAEPERRALADEGWLLPGEGDPSQRFLLKYVALEAHTVCNQSCYFCPVSVAPREDYFMPTELYERIVGELTEFRDTIEGVVMINYNEPTVDRRFLDQVRLLHGSGLKPAVLTNGSGLTPDRIDALVAMGGLRFLSVNLSTLEADRYKKERGAAHLTQVLRNLDHAADKPVAREMDIVVLGTGNQAHQDDFAAISERFRGSRFNVKSFEVMDRAGYLQIGLKPANPNRQLRGCDNVGSRPLQHLHITPRGRCVLCCEDYSEHYAVGDLTRESVRDVLAGPGLAQMRRWVYGLEPAPENFICRDCIFARTVQG